MSANISILTKLQMFFLKFLNIFLANQKKTSHTVMGGERFLKLLEALTVSTRLNYRLL